jgi:uroporphyrinogen decarboxylase
MTLTSRQRVLAAVNHQDPDRVPIDLSGHRASGMAAIAYNRLKKHLGIDSGAIYVYDKVQHGDHQAESWIIWVWYDRAGRAFAHNPDDWHDWELQDGTPCKIPAHIRPVRVDRDWYIYHADGTPIAVQREGCYYFEQTCFPLADRDGYKFDDLNADMDKVMWVAMGSPPAPHGYDQAGLEALHDGARHLRQTSERAIVCLFGANMLEMGQFLFGIQNFLTLLASEPRRVHLFLDKLLEVYLGKLEALTSAVGPYIDVIHYNDDFGMQTGPQISLKMYLDFHLSTPALRRSGLTDAKSVLRAGLSLLPSLIGPGWISSRPDQQSQHGS